MSVSALIRLWRLGAETTHERKEPRRSRTRIRGSYAAYLGHLPYKDRDLPPVAARISHTTSPQSKESGRSNVFLIIFSFQNSFADDGSASAIGDKSISEKLPVQFCFTTSDSADIAALLWT